MWGCGWLSAAAVLGCLYYLFGGTACQDERIQDGNPHWLDAKSFTLYLPSETEKYGIICIGQRNRIFVPFSSSNLPRALACFFTCLRFETPKQLFRFLDADMSLAQSLQDGQLRVV
jgi:hypothetical protein